jgi:hypothetical protein
MKLCPPSEAAIRATSKKIIQHFMEPEGFLPCSHVLSFSPYSRQDQSNHSTPPCPASLRSTLILSTHLRSGLPSGLFTSRLHHQNPT